MGCGEPYLAVVVGVAEQQAAIDEDPQRDPQRLGQAGEPDPPPGASTGLVDGDQASESGHHRGFGQAASLDGLSEHGVGMPGQRAPDTAEVAIAGQGQRASDGQALCQLPQGEGEQGQRLSAVGVGDQRSGQSVVQAQPGHLRRPFDDLAQHLPVQRSQHIGLDRHPGQRGQVPQVIEELRPHRHDHLHRTGDRGAHQLRESRPGARRRPGEQLFALVDRHQQPLVCSGAGCQ